MFGCKKLKRLNVIKVQIIIFIVSLYLMSLIVVNLNVAFYYKGLEERNFERFHTFEKDHVFNILSLHLNKTNIFHPVCNCHKYSLNLTLFKSGKLKIFKILSFNNVKKKLLYEISKDDVGYSYMSCGYYHSLRRGKSQKVVSVSLFGKIANYTNQLKVLVDQVKRYYPGWILRVFHDNSVDKSIICQFECSYEMVDFCNVNELNTNKNTKLEISKYNGMYWRWLPAADSFVDYFMSRDIDSWITSREKSAVDDWLKGNSIFHIMRGK